MAKVGKPALVFSVPNDGIAIPNGLLACCRVLHAPECAHHIAGSILGIAYTLQSKDGGDGEAPNPWRDERSHQMGLAGDLLADQNALWARVRAAWMIIQENARIAEAEVTELTCAVFSLGRDLWAEWSHLDAERREREGQRLAVLQQTSDDLTDQQLAELPLLLVDPDEDGEGEDSRGALAQLMAAERFRPTDAYAHRILTMPGEVGHDDRARYVLSSVLAAPEQEPIPWMAPHA